jgi:hypothetical protein
MTGSACLVEKPGPFTSSPLPRRAAAISGKEGGTGHTTAVHRGQIKQQYYE